MASDAASNQVALVRTLEPRSYVSDRPAKAYPCIEAHDKNHCDPPVGDGPITI
jgi:hypothetical protein